MPRWIGFLLSVSLVATTVILWLNYVIPLAPTLVVRISPFTAAVIDAKARGKVDEQVFYDRVQAWGPNRVESCYALFERSQDAQQRQWALIAIGHAGTLDDIERLKRLISLKVLSVDDERAANHALGVLAWRGVAK